MRSHDRRQRRPQSNRWHSPKHLAGTETAQPGNLAQTGDRTGLIGETFAIGGTVLVAAGVFLDQKKRREQMQKRAGRWISASVQRPVSRTGRSV